MSIDAYPLYHRDKIEFALERNDCECRMCLKARAEAEMALEALLGLATTQEVARLREALQQVAYSHEDWVRDIARAALAARVDA